MLKIFQTFPVQFDKIKIMSDNLLKPVKHKAGWGE